MNFKSNSKGFTLIEVVISIFILAMISFSIYQITHHTYKLRMSIQKEADFRNNIRLGLNILWRDLAQVYSPTFFLPDPPPIPQALNNSVNNNPPPPPIYAPFTFGANQELRTISDFGVSYPFWSPAIQESGIRPSHFIGSADKMSFISASHYRIYKDSPESELVKIIYQLEPDRENSDTSGRKILKKIEGTNTFALDESDDKSKRTFIIFKGIKTLEFSYYKRETGGLVWRIFNSWDNERQETFNLYPDMIGIKLEIHQKDLSFAGQFKFRLEVPLYGLPPTF